MCTWDCLTHPRVLAATGQLQQSIKVLRRGSPAETDIAPRPSDVLWILERARVAERLGDRRSAPVSYRYVADVWARADPVLQPFVREARAGLGRMGVRRK